MLTKSHTSACTLDHSQDRAAYRLHMCGLCHALGDNYGLPQRLLTNHEMIVLNLLTSAQRPVALEVVTRRCPLNPLLHVTTNRDSASQFAAATAIELATVSLDDDMQDSGGRNIKARVVRNLLNASEHKALDVLDNLGFDSSHLTQLNNHQSAVEMALDVGAHGRAPLHANNMNLDNPAAPSAESSASLFAMTARLAGVPENETPLAAIGAFYGTFVYLLDAYRDFAQDMARGDFNPLRVYAAQSGDGVLLTPAGLDWLMAQFESALMGIRAQLPLVKFQRYQDTVARLLCQPLEQILEELGQQREIHYRQWRWLDALKAAFFVLPTPALDTGIGGILAVDGEPESDAPEQPKRGKAKNKRKRKEHPNTRATTTSSDTPTWVDCGMDACYACSFCGDNNSSRGDTSCCGSICGDICNQGADGNCGNIDCNPCDGDGCSGCGDGGCDCSPSS